MGCFMILKIDNSEMRISYAKELISMKDAIIESEVKIDIEDNCINELQDLFFHTDCASITILSDDDKVLADYSNYGLGHLEQSIMDDIVVTSIILVNVTA